MLEPLRTHLGARHASALAKARSSLFRTPSPLNGRSPHRDLHREFIQGHQEPGAGLPNKQQSRSLKLCLIVVEDGRLSPRRGLLSSDATHHVDD